MTVCAWSETHRVLRGCCNLAPVQVNARLDPTHQVSAVLIKQDLHHPGLTCTNQQGVEGEAGQVLTTLSVQQVPAGVQSGEGRV